MGLFGWLHVENETKEELKNTSSFLAWVMFNCENIKEKSFKGKLSSVFGPETKTHPHGEVQQAVG